MILRVASRAPGGSLKAAISVGNRSQNACFVGQNVGQRDVSVHPNLLQSLFLLVGMARFELTTPASRRQCSTRLSYTPTRRYLIKFLNQIREGVVDSRESNRCVELSRPCLPKIEPYQPGPSPRHGTP